MEYKVFKEMLEYKEMMEMMGILDYKVSRECRVIKEV